MPGSIKCERYPTKASIHFQLVSVRYYGLPNCKLDSIQEGVIEFKVQGQKPIGSGQDYDCRWSVEESTQVSPKFVKFSPYTFHRDYKDGYNEVFQSINSGYPDPIEQRFFVEKIQGPKIVTVYCKFSFPTLSGWKDQVEAIFIEVG
jgi:hypothetical protein